METTEIVLLSLTQTCAHGAPFLLAKLSVSREWALGEALTALCPV